jgi:hypothetical protein
MMNDHLTYGIVNGLQFLRNLRNAISSWLQSID